jgi:hypothetical protein
MKINSIKFLAINSGLDGFFFSWIKIKIQRIVAKTKAVYCQCNLIDITLISKATSSRTNSSSTCANSC